MRNDFVVFILSHGRANKMYTYDALRKAGYTGKIVVVIDNEDSTADKYYERFGDEVYMFDKIESAKHIDSMDLSDDRRAILYARCECFNIAKKLGYKYFLELDDDYVNFRSRVPMGDKFGTIYIRDFDKLVDIFLEFLETTKAHTVAMSQIGDLIGGTTSHLWKQQIARKAMNSFFCTTDRPFKWFGRMNEDVSTYVHLGSIGYLFFTVANVSVDQLATQSLSGGMSESYLDSGTYVKTFYTIMCSPSCVKVESIGNRNRRFHHKINWEHAVPKIISGSYKK